ncbi:MAG: response regulator [Deltaproteobacteria bacterium]|nr:response regulator [Deltaproteobacteria bacterium]
MKKTPTLLIVDDEEEIRKLLYRHFKLKEYNAFLAQDVDSAEKELAKRRFDVVICDIMMPGRLGTELLLTIRDEYPMTHAIMITGQVTMGNAMACMRRRADTCIFKPLEDLKELDEAVDRAVGDIRRWNRKLAQLKGL